MSGHQSYLLTKVLARCLALLMIVASQGCDNSEDGRSAQGDTTEAVAPMADEAAHETDQQQDHPADLPASGSATGSQSLDDRLAAVEIPPPWLADVQTAYDTSLPWAEARLEIRRLLGLGQPQSHREALKLTWIYLQKDDINDGHEYPMYTFMGGEPLWSIRAHQWYLAQPHENTPIHAFVSALPVLTRGLLFTVGRAQLGLIKGPGHLSPVGGSSYVSLALFSCVFLFSLLGRRFWCRYVCPSGALLSVFNFLRIGQRQVESSCIHCNKCIEICPTGAIQPLTLEVKRQTHMGLAQVNTDTCLPHRDQGREDCDLCYVECRQAGYDAIEMREIHIELDPPPPEGMFSETELQAMSRILAPSVIAEACVGCGICQYRCHTTYVKQTQRLERSAIIVRNG